MIECRTCRVAQEAENERDKALSLAYKLKVFAVGMADKYGDDQCADYLSEILSCEPSKIMAKHDASIIRQAVLRWEDDLETDMDCDAWLYDEDDRMERGG